MVENVVTGVEERNQLASGSVPCGPTEAKAFQMKIVEPHADADEGTTKEMQIEPAWPVEGLPCLKQWWWAIMSP